MEDLVTYIKTAIKYLCLTHIVILAYDVSKKKTFFNTINKWYYILKRRKQNTSCVVFLVGCKNDLKREVTYEEGEKIAKKFNIFFFETSCLRDKTDDIFNYMIQIMANAGHQQFVNEFEPHESKWTKEIHDNPNIGIILKKPVVMIPEYEKIDETIRLLQEEEEEVHVNPTSARIGSSVELDDQINSTDWDSPSPIEISKTKMRDRDRLATNIRKSVLINPRTSRASVVNNSKKYLEVRNAFNDFNGNDEEDEEEEQEFLKERKRRSAMLDELPEISLENLLHLEESDRMGHDDGTVSIQRKYGSTEEFPEVSIQFTPTKPTTPSKSIEMIDVESLFFSPTKNTILLKTVQRSSHRQSDFESDEEF
jgi:GTPase SAR1 family protein